MQACSKHHHAAPSLPDGSHPGLDLAARSAAPVAFQWRCAPPLSSKEAHGEAARRYQTPSAPRPRRCAAVPGPVGCGTSRSPSWPYDQSNVAYPAARGRPMLPTAMPTRS